MIFGNVVDVVLEVTNMDDAVRMTNWEGDTVLSPARCALICLKIMRIEGTNLNKQFTIYKGGQYLLNINNTNETASKQFKGR
jgi:hypothetical protein